MRWLWLQKTDLGRPWANLPIHVPNKARAFFSMALISKVRDGSNTLFWNDRWLHGTRISDIAPSLYKSIPRRIANRRTVKEALLNRIWISDIGGGGGSYSKSLGRLSKSLGIHLRD
jgi:hypothetical protein